MVQCTNALEQLAASMIRIVNFFQHNLLILDNPENGGRKFLRILVPIYQSADGVMFYKTQIFVSCDCHM
jgi:hypothetical protein